MNESGDGGMDIAGLTAYYAIMAVADAVAAIIAAIIFLKTIKLYGKLGALWVLLLAIGYIMLSVNFAVSSLSYAVASINAASAPLGHHHLGGMWFNCMGYPLHWPGYDRGIKMTPLWLLIEFMYVLSYLMIVASLALSVKSYENTKNLQPNETLSTWASLAAIAITPLLFFGLNVVSVILMMAAVAIIFLEFWPKIPSSAIGYGLLASSHVIEIASLTFRSPELMLVAEILRPIALFAIGAGMRRA